MEKELFYQACRKHFGYLIDEFGYREGAKEADSWTLAVYFVGQSAYARVSLEWEYSGVFVELGRVVNGQPMRNPIIIREDSELNMFTLDDVLALRAPDLGLSPIFKSEPEIVSKIAIYAHALRAHAQDILVGDFSLFPALERVVKERARALKQT